VGPPPSPSNPASPATPLPSGTLCTASDRVMADGLPVGAMYRVQPGSPADSGWRFLAGDEDAAYLATHVHQHALSAVSSRDPQIPPLLSSPIGSAYIRNPLTKGLVKADDWEPPLSS
jgi:hypothetical protein